MQLCIFLVPNLGQQSRRHSGAVHELRVAVRDLVARARGRCPLGTFLADCLARYESGKSSEDKMVQMVLEMILAGTDTSSVTMFYLILAARDDPDLERMLLEEATTGKRSDYRLTIPKSALSMHDH